MVETFPRISVVMHTRNSQETLEKAMESVSWADEIIIVDMASEDATLEIARRFTDRIISIPFYPRVDGVRNRYLDEAASEWVLVLDSDEFLSHDAPRELKHLITLLGEKYDAFALPRYNIIAGQIMKGGAWYPDYQIRLFRKGTVKWLDGTHILPKVVTGPHRLFEIKSPDRPHIHHRNYPSLQEFIRRQVDYALQDTYESDFRQFDFSDFVARAYEALAIRSDRENDGDLSHALSLVMAWDAVIRGLIQWERLSTRPPLGFFAALPIATGRVSWWRISLRRWLWRRHSMWFFIRRLWEILRWIALKVGIRRV